LLATALGLGEVTAANRDAAAAAAALTHDAERSRFARELHDVLSHQLSAIAVQAGAARLASQRDPGVAVRTVAGIEDIARQGLIELNRIVAAVAGRGGPEQGCTLPALATSGRLPVPGARQPGRQGREHAR
jgi:signal transduction histidine kinase